MSNDKKVLRVLIHHTACGALIGQRGDVQKDIERKYGVVMNIQKFHAVEPRLFDGVDWRIVHFMFHTTDALCQALQHVLPILTETRASIFAALPTPRQVDPNEHFLVTLIPDFSAEYLLAKHSSLLRQASSDGCTINIRDQLPNCDDFRLSIQGNLSALLCAAACLIPWLIVPTNPPQKYRPYQLTMPVLLSDNFGIKRVHIAKDKIKFFTGKNGDRQNEIFIRTSCLIHVKPDALKQDEQGDDPRHLVEIEVRGPSRNLTVATQMVFYSELAMQVAASRALKHEEHLKKRKRSNYMKRRDKYENIPYFRRDEFENKMTIAEREYQNEMKRQSKEEVHLPHQVQPEKSQQQQQQTQHQQQQVPQQQHQVQQQQLQQQVQQQQQQVQQQQQQHFSKKRLYTREQHFNRQNQQHNQQYQSHHQQQHQHYYAHQHHQQQNQPQSSQQQVQHQLPVTSPPQQHKHTSSIPLKGLTPVSPNQFLFPTGVTFLQQSIKVPSGLTPVDGLKPASLPVGLTSVAEPQSELAITQQLQQQQLQQQHQRLQQQHQAQLGTRMSDTCSSAMSNAMQQPQFPAQQQQHQQPNQQQVFAPSAARVTNNPSQFSVSNNQQQHIQFQQQQQQQPNVAAAYRLQRHQIEQQHVQQFQFENQQLQQQHFQRLQQQHPPQHVRSVVYPAAQSNQQQQQQQQQHHMQQQLHTVAMRNSANNVTNTVPLNNSNCTTNNGNNHVNSNFNNNTYQNTSNNNNNSSFNFRPALPIPSNATMRDSTDNIYFVDQRDSSTMGGVDLNITVNNNNTNNTNIHFQQQQKQPTQFTLQIADTPSNPINTPGIALVNSPSVDSALQQQQQQQQTRSFYPNQGFAPSFQ